MTAPPASGKPTMYCRGCFYALDGLSEHRCPECGRTFDPADPRTYRTKPRRWWHNSAVRALLAAVLLGLALLGAAGGWFYWRYGIVEQRGIAAVTALGGTCSTEPVLSGWPAVLARRLGLPVVKTVTRVQNLPPSTGDDDLKRIAELGNVTTMELQRTQVTDSGMAHLRRLRHLQFLRLHRCSRVTDEGMANLKGMTELRGLGLGHTQITDAGLARLKGLDLEELDLTGTQITNAGLPHLEGLANLRLVFLTDTRITDAGLVHLSEIPRLRALSLLRTKTTDAGFVHLERLTNLEYLSLAETAITDEGLTHLKGLSKLQDLDLTATGITDGAVVHLQALKSLKQLGLQATRMTKDGVARLEKSFRPSRVSILGP